MRLRILDRLCTPEERKVFRKEVVFGSQCQQRIDLVAVTILSKTNRSPTTTTELEVLGERVDRGELRSSRCRSYEGSTIVCRAILSSNRVGSYGDRTSCGSRERQQTITQPHQVTRDFVEGIGTPELEVGTTLQKLTYTLGILDPRKFDEDTTLTFETLQVRSDDTKAVDTCTQDVE